jgi:hypothetical protein
MGLVCTSRGPSDLSSGLLERPTHHFYQMLQSGELTREPTGDVHCGQEATPDGLT